MCGCGQKEQQTIVTTEQAEGSRTGQGTGSETSS
jgi:hypothetical protein